MRQDITTAIAGAQAAGPDCSQHDMGKVLADAPFVLERNGNGCVHIGCRRVEFKLFLEGSQQRQQRLTVGNVVRKKRRPKAITGSLSGVIAVG